MDCKINKMAYNDYHAYKILVFYHSPYDVLTYP